MNAKVLTTQDLQIHTIQSIKLASLNKYPQVLNQVYFKVQRLTVPRRFSPVFSKSRLVTNGISIH